MNRKFALTAAIAALCLSTSAAMAGDFEISGYGGIQSAVGSHVDMSDQPDFHADWEGKSFSSPPYWGVRGTYWFTDGSWKDLGISLDYSHDKVYATKSTMARAGFSHFEFTDGLNLLTLNALYRFPIEDSPFVPYIGAGIGINVPHVEVTRPSGKTFEYQFGGATLQAQAGVAYRVTDNWSAFLEYKGTYSFIDTDIDHGGTLKTNMMTNAVNFGVSYKF